MNLAWHLLVSYPLIIYALTYSRVARLITHPALIDVQNWGIDKRLVHNLSDYDRLPSTAVKAQVMSQKEIWLVINGQIPFPAM